MDQLRRAALTLAAVVASGSAARAPERSLRFIAADGGKLRITAGERQATIAPVIAVEEAVGREWQEVGEINAVDRCGEIGADVDKAPVRLAAGQIMDVVPWRGWTCEAQCPRTCGFNIYLGPGSFRFVGRLAPSGAWIASNAFVMPGRDAAPR